jgi:hypothetical protein
MPAIRRRDLLAYVSGAAVAGTILVLPYVGRAILTQLWPGGPALEMPFFLLPLVFGAWNVVRVRRGAPLGAATWGVLLGLVVAAGGNALMALRGLWTPSLLLLFGWVPAVYAIAWTFLVAPLNHALEADG